MLKVKTKVQNIRSGDLIATWVFNAASFGGFDHTYYHLCEKALFSGHQMKLLTVIDVDTDVDAFSVLELSGYILFYDEVVVVLV